MSEESPTVYRRRNSTRSEGDGRQRVIGGIGRRRNTTNNAFQSRIQQFAGNGGDDNNNSSSTTIATASSESINKISATAAGVNGNTTKPGTLLTSSSQSQFVSPAPRRRTKVSRSDSNISDSKTPELTRRYQRQNINNDVEKSEDKQPPNVSNLAQGRRVSIATTTGKEHSQNFVRSKRSESTNNLAQGNLLQSKNLKWETLSSSSGASDNTTKDDSIVLKEKSVTPPVVRKASEETAARSNNGFTKVPIPTQSMLRPGLPSKEKSQDVTEKPNAKDQVKDRAPLGVGGGYKTQSATNISEKVKKSTSNIEKVEKETPVKNEVSSVITQNVQEQTPEDTSKVENKKKTPPPVLPRKKSFRKTSTNIMAIQSQLETNFEKPKTTREAEKKAAATRQQLSALTPTSSMESVSNQAKLIRKSKSKLHDINNNDSDGNTCSSSTEDKINKTSVDLSPAVVSKATTTTTTTATSTTKSNNSSISISNNKKGSFLKTLGSTEVTPRTRGKSPIRTPVGVKSTSLKNPDLPTSTKQQAQIEQDSNVETTSHNRRVNCKTRTGECIENINIKNKNIRENIEINKSEFEENKIKLTQTSNSDIYFNKEAPKQTEKYNKSTPGLLNESAQATLNDGFHSHTTTTCDNTENDDANKQRTRNAGENNNSLTKTLDKDEQNETTIHSNGKTITDQIVSDHDNSNCTGLQSIANSVHAERNFADQKESSQQKNQGDHLFSAPTSERVAHPDDCTFVSTQENNNNKTVGSNKNLVKTDYSVGNNDTKVRASFGSDNYASFKKVSERLQAATRDRSNTWTTSDSDENILDREDLKSDSSYSSNNNKNEERGGFGRRRRLTKKRSKRSKTKPTIVKLSHERHCRQKSFDTSDGDILDSNYTSDDKSRISSGVESTLCDSDINYSDNLDILDVVESKHKVSYSNTVKENTEILKSQSVGNKNNNISDQSLISTKESIQKLTREINDNNVGHGTYLKSSSMTTISGTRIQSLMSFSSTDMGGSRSEDDSKLLNFKKGRDDPNIGSLSKVSTKVIQSFNSKPIFSPISKRRTESPYSTSYSEIPFTQNNNNSIKENPFTLSTNYGGKERFSDGEHEITSRLEKLSEDAKSRRSYTLPNTVRLRQPPEFKKTPLSLTEIGKPSQEGQSAKDVLNNLPSSPFTLLNRFTRDTQIMQSKSTGSLGKRATQQELIDAIDETNNDISATDSTTYINGNLEDNYIAPPDNFKDNIPSRVKTRPPLNITGSIEAPSNDDIDNPLQENHKPLRRSSYLEACETGEEGQQHTNDVRATKRPGKRTRPMLPATMLTSESIEDQEQDRDDVLSPTSPTVKEECDSDSDEDLTIDFKNLVENVKNKSSRPRAPLAQPPLLDGIPEEHGHKKDGDIRKRRPRKPIFAEDTICEEPREPTTPETPKPDNENDYNSQGSLRSTPKELSFDEDLSSEVEADNKEDEVIIDKEKVKEGPSQTWPSKHISNSKSWSEIPNDLELPSVRTSSSSMSGIDKSRITGITSNEENVLDSPVIPTITTPGSPTSRSVPPVPKKKTPNTEMRRHVLQNLLETERSYVQNLSAMLTMFYNPLKRPENISIIEPSLVDEIFYQIPDILENHEFFLEQLTNRVNAWSNEQIIADIFISSFTKCLLMDAYSSFINNFVQAKAAIRQASARPQFRRYVEQCTKEHREKLTLSDLLIMPVQRIPRYVLILKDMLKYTPVEHPDYGNLQLALGEIKTLADRMNKGEVEADQAERDIEKLRDIEQTIEGITDLVTSTRKFIRQDLVAENKGSITKKDRCLFLFSDLLVCATVRRKNNNFRRGSLGLFTGQSAAELNRYKFVWKYPLDDIEISKANNTQQNFDNEDIERLDEDIRILNNMLTVAERLSMPHQSLDQHLREFISDARNQIQERQNQSPPTAISPMLTKMELQAHADGITEPYTFIFLSAECKSSWEAYFEDAQQKLAYSRDTFPPEFQYPTPITKTRSGMQFTCAAPSYITGFGDAHSRALTSGFVWVCNSDGYVGQVCLLSMIPEAQSKASLSVCQSRIVCIAVVPGARIVRGKNGGGENLNDGIIGKKVKPMKQGSFGHKHKKSLPSDMSDEDDEDFGTGAENIIAFDSSGDEDMHPHFMGGTGNAFGGRMSPDGSSLGAGESMEGERDSTDDDYSSDDDEHDRLDPTRGIPIGNSGYSSKSGLDDYMNTDLDGQATMWLGTEDGHIYVYNAQDTITQRKSIAKRNLGSCITSILYFENKVFIALGSGELCIYKRELGGGAWQLSSPEIIHVSITGSAIACMTAVAGRIWCGCQNTIVLVNATSLKLETNITVSPDHNRAVHKIVSSGLGVWVTIQNSATVRLYHATTYENLHDIDVAPAVHKMLAGADAIIRQHKAACLRVTSLLICKDLLWIGTSAGVILTNPLPSITASTSVLRHSVGPTGSPHGHTGHVRFLTSVEVPKAAFKGTEYDNTRISPSPNNRIKRKDLLDKQKSLDLSDNNGTVTLVVSGGDGYEDLYNQQSEAVGRDDSTNHLLIWRV